MNKYQVYTEEQGNLYINADGYEIYEGFLVFSKKIDENYKPIATFKSWLNIIWLMND